MKKKCVFGCAALGCVAAFATEPVGGVLTFDVASGTENYTGSLSDVTSIVKKGAGKAYLKLGANTSSGFTGTVVIEGGTMGADDLLNWGTPSSFEIKSGGALDLAAITGHSSSPTNLRNVPVTVSGSGVAGTSLGAIYLSAANGGVLQYESVFGNLRLGADAVLNTPNRWTITGTVDFNGHDLIHTGGGLFSFESVTKTLNPGRIVNRSGPFNLGGSTLLDGDGEIVLEDGTFQFWRNQKDVNWKITASKSAKLLGSSNASGTYGTQNVVAADITHTNGTFVLSADAGASLTVRDAAIVTSDHLFPAGSTTTAGPYMQISGSGSVFLKNTSLSNCIANTKSECLDVACASFEWTAPGKRSYLSRVGWVSTNAWVHDAGRIDIRQGRSWYLENSSRGKASPPRLTIEGTTLVGPFDTSTYGSYQTLMLANSSDNRSGVLVIGEGAVFTNGMLIGGRGQATVYQRGGDFGWFSGDALGMRHIASGCYFLTGGHGARFSDFAIASCGDGFFRQTGGSYEHKDGDYTYLGHFGYAEMVVAGGTYSSPASHHVAYPSASSLVKEELPQMTRPHPGANLTVTGAGTLFDNPNAFYFNDATQACTTVVNVNDGGVFRVKRMARQYVTNAYEDVKAYVNLNGGVLRFALANIYDVRNNQAYLPDAVTLYEKGVVLDTTGMAAEDMDTKNPGTNMRDYIYLNWPLKAATGKGVSAVSLPTDASFLAEKYAGPTHVTIVDPTGAGYGASAILDWDPETGAVKGIVVTSHGCNYGDTTYATVDSAYGYTNTYACAVTLAANATDGGIVKRGPYAVRLNFPNAFTGGVTVEEGELLASNHNAVPNGNALTLKGGLYGSSLNNYSLSVSTLSGYGALSNGAYTVTQGLSVSATDLLAGRSLAVAPSTSLAFGAGATVALTGYAALSDAQKKAFEAAGRFPLVTFATAYTGDIPTALDVPETWKLMLSKGRTELVLKRRSGVCIIVR